MKLVVFSAFVSVLAGVFILASTMAEAQVLDDRANLKILKTRAKMATGSSTYVNSGGQLDAVQGLEDKVRSRVDCGAVDIANQHVDSNFSGQINIIISGDIINTGNRCR